MRWEDDPNAHKLTFEHWLALEAFNWLALGLLGGLATAIGTENIIRGAMVLVGVFVVGIVVWAARARW